MAEYINREDVLKCLEYNITRFRSRVRMMLFLRLSG